MGDSSIIRGRRRRRKLRKTISRTIKRDLELNGLLLDLIHNRELWCFLIYKADHTNGK